VVDMVLQLPGKEDLTPTSDGFPRQPSSHLTQQMRLTLAALAVMMTAFIPFPHTLACQLLYLAKCQDQWQCAGHAHRVQTNTKDAYQMLVTDLHKQSPTLR
jgi:hypothetical protein